MNQGDYTLLEYCNCKTQMAMKDRFKEEAAARLKKMAGQVNGIAKMVDEDRYCVDILTQVAALRAALERLGSLVASAHIEECVYGRSAIEESSEERLEEVRKTLNRFLK